MGSGGRGRHTFTRYPSRNERSRHTASHRISRDGRRQRIAARGHRRARWRCARSHRRRATDRAQVFPLPRRQRHVDITAGALRSVWDFKREPPVRPDPGQLRAALANIGWGAVEWSSTTIRLPRPGMQVDFGGIGKEYAADRVATIAQERYARHGCVNLGGDVRVWGGRPDGSAWRVGIRHPRAQEAAMAGVDLHDGAVATSGDYERYVDIDGKRYCHIIDARTGEPVSAWRSVSVVAPLAIVAGSYATIAMLMQHDAQAWLDRAALRWLGVDAGGGL